MQMTTTMMVQFTPCFREEKPHRLILNFYLTAELFCCNFQIKMMKTPMVGTEGMTAEMTENQKTELLKIK